MGPEAPEEAREIARELVEQLGPAEQEMLHRRKLFIQRGRAAAREALFYLGMLYETDRTDCNEAIREYCGFALRQAESLYFPPPTSPLDAVVPRLTAQSRGPGTRAGREIEHLQQAVDAWVAIGLEFQKLRVDAAGCLDDQQGDGGEPATEAEAGSTLQAARELRILYQRFLDLSLPASFAASLVGFRIPDALRLARKRLALLLAMLLVGFVALEVEAVSTLLFDHSWTTLLIVLYLAAPTLYWLFAIYSRRKGEEIPFWDVGGRPFRSLEHAALEPDQLMRRWPGRRSAARIEVPEAAAIEMVEEERDFFAGLVKDLRPPRSDGMVRLTHGGVNYRLGWTLGLWSLGMAFCLFGLPGLGTLLGDSTTSTSVATVYAISAILMGILWVARVIDFWEFIEALPMRLILLTLAALVGLGMWNGWDRWFFLPLFVGAAFYFWWYRRNPLRETRRRMVLILVAAGLANLSGLFTQDRAGWDPEVLESAAPLKRVTGERWPLGGAEQGPVVVLAASGGGSRAALYTGLTLAKLHGVADIPDVDNDDPADVELFAEVARNLQAISSVSGGSLANAAYVSRRLRGSEIADLPETMSQDFIGPALWGFVTIGLNRGDGIEQSWQGFERRWQDWISFERLPCGTNPELPGENGEPPRRSLRPRGVRLGNLCLRDLVEAWTGETPPFPMPIFNTSSLDGHDIVISPLAKSLYTNERLHSQAEQRRPEDEPTWVYDRDGIYGLENLVPGFDPHLSAAVRASANFPFGFPLVEVRSRQKLIFSPIERHRETDTRKRIRVTDGGALSNSGMFPLYNLLVNEREDLRERGVLLLIVDASKMPTYPDLTEKATNLMGTIGDQSPIGQQLHRRMFDHLQAIYGDMFAVSQIDLTPDESKNVLTTWALSKDSARTLRQVFNERWAHEKGALRAKWRHLEKANEERRAARDLLAAVAGPADRAARYQEVLTKLLSAGDAALSGAERRLLQILSDEHLAPAGTELEAAGEDIPLVSGDRPPLD